MTAIADMPRELPFRIWTVLAPQIVAAKDDLAAVRCLLEPYAEAAIYGWQEEDKPFDFERCHVFQCAAEARAHLAEIAQPDRFYRSTREPKPRPRRTLYTSRLGNHLASDKLVAKLASRCTSVTPYDPETLPENPNWLWNIDVDGRYNLLADGDRLVLPPAWARPSRDIGPMALRTPHINIHDSHGRMGVLSRAGQLTVPCRFAYIGDADCYPPYAFEASEEAVPESLGACDIIDHTGKRLNPPGVKALAGTLWFGLAVVVREDDPQGKQGFMASDGRLLGDIRWHALTRHNSRLALAQDPESKLWGYVNQAGAVAIEPRFTRLAGFASDRAAVSPPEADGLFGLIDRTGTLVVPAVWRDVKCFNGNLFQVESTDGKLGLIDEIGRVVIEPRHLTSEEEQEIEDNSHYIRRHPFTLERAKMLRARIEAAIAGSDTLAPIAGMLMPNAISDTELEAAGLLGMHVEVVADSDAPGRLVSPRAGDRGYIGWHYPVTASLFDFTVEAPVEGLRALPHGSVGVPWRLLRRVPDRV